MKVEKKQSLKSYNTFGIDSYADTFVLLEESADFHELLRAGLLDGEAHFVLGGGSNVILPDKYEGVVVHPANTGVRLVEEIDGQCFVEAGAGVVWADFVDICIANGWHGIENLAAIPGTVGAAPVQNVGAYGREAKDVIDRVHFFDIESGAERWVGNADCQFGYRTSLFKVAFKGRCLIDRVQFRLQRAFVPDLSYSALSAVVAERYSGGITARQLADEVKRVRDSKLPDPKVTGSAGSFFKNPVVSEEKYEALRRDYPRLVAFPAEAGYKLSAGWLIEYCGWKGRTEGRVGVYEKQALVLVNRGNCTSGEVRALADRIIGDVAMRFGVTLECEAIFV